MPPKDPDLKKQINDLLHRYQLENAKFGRQAAKAFDEIGVDLHEQRRVVIQLEAQIEAMRQSREAEIHSLCQGEPDLDLTALKEVQEGVIGVRFLLEWIVLRRDFARESKRIAGNPYEAPEALKNLKEQEESIKGSKELAICRLHEKIEMRREALKDEEATRRLNEAVKKALERRDSERDGKDEKDTADGPDLWKPFETHRLTSPQMEIVEALINARNHKLTWDYIAVNVLNKENAKLADAFRSRPGVLGKECSEAPIWKLKGSPQRLCLNPNNT